MTPTEIRDLSDVAIASDLQELQLIQQHADDALRVRFGRALIDIWTERAQSAGRAAWSDIVAQYQPGDYIKASRQAHAHPAPAKPNHRAIARYRRLKRGR